MIVLICASVLVSIESLMTHRRQRQAQAKIAGMQKMINLLSPHMHDKDRDNWAMIEVARKHGVESEMIEAMNTARDREERENRIAADEATILPK